MSGQKVMLGSETGDSVMWVGPLGDTAVLQDVAFYTVFGLLFDVEHYEATLADAATVDVVLTLPAVSSPVVVGETELIAVASEVTVDGDATVQIYQNPTYTTDSGTAKTPVNRNEISAITSNVHAEVNPTVTDVGTLRNTSLITGGSGGKAIGADVVVGRRIIGPGQSRLIRVTNDSGKVAKAVITTTWIEGKKGAV